MVHDPLAPSEALRTRIGTAIFGVSLLILVYSVVIMAQLFWGLLIAGFLTLGLYVTYRILAVLDSVAEAALRHAKAKEREVGLAETAATDGVASDEPTPTNSVLRDREE